MSNINNINIVYKYIDSWIWNVVYVYKYAIRFISIFIKWSIGFHWFKESLMCFFYIIEFSLTSSYNGHAYPPYGRGVL